MATMRHLIWEMIGSDPTVDVRLVYGTSGLTVSLPAARTTVVRPSEQAAALDPAATLRQALEAPVAGPRLRGIVKPGDTIAVSVCDLTRPQPREAMVRGLVTNLGEPYRAYAKGKKRLLPRVW